MRMLLLPLRLLLLLQVNLLQVNQTNHACR
jgi:hypothetical protein